MHGSLYHIVRDGIKVGERDGTRLPWWWPLLWLCATTERLVWGRGIPLSWCQRPPLCRLFYRLILRFCSKVKCLMSHEVSSGEIFPPILLTLGLDTATPTISHRQGWISYVSPLKRSWLSGGGISHGQTYTLKLPAYIQLQSQLRSASTALIKANMGHPKHVQCLSRAEVARPFRQDAQYWP